MCKFSSKSGGVPFQPLGDLTWNDPLPVKRSFCSVISEGAAWRYCTPIDLYTYTPVHSYALVHLYICTPKHLYTCTVAHPCTLINLYTYPNVHPYILYTSKSIYFVHL